MTCICCTRGRFRGLRCHVADRGGGGDLEAGRLIDLLAHWRPTKWIVHAIFPSRRGLLPSGSYTSTLQRAAQGITREGAELVEGAIRG